MDEIDSILLDSAQTPLIISGSPRVQSNLYGIVDTLVRTFQKGEEYKIDGDKKQVWLTPKGVKAAEAFLSIQHLYDPQHRDLVRHINLALQAHQNYTKDKDYVVRVNEKGGEGDCPSRSGNGASHGIDSPSRGDFIRHLKPRKDFL